MPAAPHRSCSRQVGCTVTSVQRTPFSSSPSATALSTFFLDSIDTHPDCQSEQPTAMHGCYHWQSLCQVSQTLTQPVLGIDGTTNAKQDTAAPRRRQPNPNPYQPVLQQHRKYPSKKTDTSPPNKPRCQPAQPLGPAHARHRRCSPRLLIEQLKQTAFPHAPQAWA